MTQITVNPTPVPDDASAPSSGALATDDLEALSTRFDRPSALSGWTEHVVPGFSPKWAAPAVRDGALELRPFTSGWFEDMQAGHLHRPVTGNFVVTARLHVSGTHAALPQTLFSLAGLFVRVPRPGLTADTWVPGQENWLFFSVGTAFPAGALQFETKTTWNSLSTLKIADARSAWHQGAEPWIELRIARQGELFSLLHRVDGTTEFTLLDQIIRPDLPASLHVGLTAYADWGGVADIYPDVRRINTMPAALTGDLVARVERVDFRRPTVDRFPVASLDPAVSFMPDVSRARLVDLVQR